MKNTISLISILLFFILTFSSCERSDPEKRRDIINVIRDGATIPAYIYGNTASKTFIILLHGGPGGSGLGYRGGIYSDRLESEYAVVYTDQRAQGMSQGSPALSSITPENMAGDVHALALSLKFKYGEDISLFLMGHSWGGLLGSTVMVNPEYAAEYKGWIEVDGAHDMPQTFKGGWRRMQEIATEQVAFGLSSTYWFDILTQLAEIDTVNNNLDGLTALNPIAFEAESTLTSNEILNEADVAYALDAIENTYLINNSITSYVSGTLTNGYLFNTENLYDYTVTNQLKQINTPTLLMWGKYDMVVSQELAVTALGQIATDDKEIVIFERSGHSPMITEPEAFSDAVITFVDRLR